MSQKVVFKNKKKDVRKIWVARLFSAHTTQENYVLHTASEKETIMGADLRVLVMSGNATANQASWEIYVAKSGEFVTLDTSGGELDVDVDKNTYLKGAERFFTADTVYSYPIKTKAKRKMSKGNLLYVSFDAQSINSDHNMLITGFFYVGE